MAKNREAGRDLAKIDAPNGIPSYLAEMAQEDTSLEGLGEHRVLPRFKVVQALSATEIVDQFGVGSVILTPGRALAMKYNSKEKVSESIKFVPLLFFPEYVKIADLNDKKSPTIMDRTFNKNSDLARKAKSPTKEGRQEKYEGGVAKYCEHLCFPGIIYSGILKGQVAVLQFARGEHSTGTNFITYLSIKKAPIWCQVFNLTSRFRERGANKWHGIDIKAPEAQEEQFVTEEESDFFQNAHKELKELQAKNLIVVENEDITDTESAVETPDGHPQM